VKYSFDKVIVHLGDEDIKRMLIEHNVALPAQTKPGLNVALVHLRNKGYSWLVMKFFHPGDEGYAAFGLPLNTPKEEVLGIWRLLLEHQEITCYSVEQLGELMDN
jgi:hypothetical protein